MNFDLEPAIGASPRPTVVLLHSSASSARQWDALVASLRPRYDVHAVDLHGHGVRPAWRGESPLALADDAALVAPLLEQAGGAHIVGHSYGAAVALKVAALHPDRVRSVLAYEPVLFRLLIDERADSGAAGEAIALAAAIRDLLDQGREHAAAQRFVEFWSGAGAWGSMSAGRQNAVAARMRSVLRHFDALSAEPQTRAELARLHMPMLLLSGARTIEATRRIAQRLRNVLASAEHEVLPAIGHMGPISHAAEVNRRISTFLHAQSTRPDASIQRADSRGFDALDPIHA